MHTYCAEFDIASRRFFSNFDTISPHGLNPLFQAAARSKSDLVDDEHFDEAIDQIMSGLKKRNAVSYKDEKRTLAVIEGGKCLLSWLLASQVILLEICLVFFC